MIDICDFAVGLSRQLYGRTMPSERPGHRLMETWHPLGVVGVISAFNFPAAVWSWNTAIALVCGDPVIWKPSELAPLTALASHAILARAIADCGAPADLSQVLIGGPDVGAALVDHPGVALLSATGSTRMGRAVGPRVADRFGRSPARARRQQRRRRERRPQTSTCRAGRGVLRGRHGRPALHDDAPRHRPQQRDRRAHRPPGLRLRPAPDRQPDGGRHPGRARSSARRGVRGDGERDRAGRDEGGKLVAGGGRELEDERPRRLLRPAGHRADRRADRRRRAGDVRTAPLRAALRRLRARPSRSTTPCRRASRPASSPPTRPRPRCSSPPEGSDCGIVNVNIGTSGAEIGGAFGGEKETGGGRESGSDAWRAYMRRATNTVNYSGELPLAQGVDFTV